MNNKFLSNLLKRIDKELIFIRIMSVKYNAKNILNTTLGLIFTASLTSFKQFVIR